MMLRTTAKQLVSAPRLLSTAAEVEVPVKLFGIEARYATAAYKAAATAKVLDQVESELKAFKQTLASSDFLAQYVANPTISREQKVKDMTDLTKEKMSYVTTNTLTALAGNNRLGDLDKVIDAFELIMKAHRKEVDAVITSAEPLTNAQTRAVSDALAPHLNAGEKVSLSTKIDPSILGGLTIQIGDKFLDLSAASKIAAIQRAL
mmetsp:Transcript_14126/g.42722  ORF Transcript_14126/g.42722 Transcript_14126/m.42722 type:complete len:205 (-) Transcript_14126:277-891(-)